MAQEDKGTNKEYRKLRDEFDDLQLEEKAVFLLEGGLSLFIHSLEHLVDIIRNEFDTKSKPARQGDEYEKEEEHPRETTHGKKGSSEGEDEHKEPTV